MQEELKAIADLLPPQEVGRRFLQPSALGRFISYDQCHRLFRLDLYTRETRGNVHKAAGTEPEYLSPAMADEGKDWERTVESALIDAGWFVTNLESSTKAGLALHYFHLTEEGQR